MIRKSFVGLAGAVIAAVVLAEAYAGAQGAAGSQPPAGGAAEKSEPAPAPQASGGSGGAIPAKTPTQQPLTGNSETTPPAPGAVMSVRIPRAVMADGKPLPAGTYQIRVTDDAPAAVAGQTPAESRWIEFVQGGEVKGRELGTIKSTSEARRIAKQGLPAPGQARVQVLYGNDYLRVWVNRGGTNFLVHLPNS